MTRVIIYIILMTAAFNLSGQYSYSGSIIDAESGTAIIGADIYHEDSQTLKVTNEDGEFSFKNMKAGKQTFIYFSYDHETLNDTIFISGDLEKSIKLSKIETELSAVVLEAKRKELFNLVSLKDIDGTAIYAGKKSEVVLVDQLVSNKANNNARQLYSQVVGLNIYENNDAGIQLNIGGRGLDPNRSANFSTRQNDYDISADVLGYPESYYTPPAEAVDQIQIIRGASSLQYGSQFGGLINFKLIEPNKYKKLDLTLRQSTGSFGFNSSYINVNGTVGKWRYLAYYTLKDLRAYRENSNLQSHNAYAYFAYDLSKNSSVSFEYTFLDYLAQQGGGLTDSQFKTDPRQSNRVRNWFKVDWNLFNLKYKLEKNNNYTFSINAFGLIAARRAVGFRGDPAQINLNPITQIDEQDPVTGEFINARDVIIGEFKNVGAEIRYLKHQSLFDVSTSTLIGAKGYIARNTNLQGPGSVSSDADFTIYSELFPDYANQSEFNLPNQSFSIFSESVIRFGKRFKVIPGLRFESIKTEARGQFINVVFDNAGNPIANIVEESNEEFGRRFLIAGIGFDYKLAKNTQLIANFSQNYRSVTFSDIRTVSPSFIIDPNITDERGFTADISLKSTIGGRLRYDLGVFNLLYDNRIGIVLDDRANRVRTNVGEALIVGLESLIEYNLIKLSDRPQSDMTLKTFVNLALTKSTYLSSIENNIEGNNVEFIPAINLKTGWQLGYRNLMTNIQLSYLSDQFTDAENSLAPNDQDSRSGLIGKIPSYTVLDWSSAYSFNRIRLEFGINNFLDTSYFTRRATGYPGPGIIPSDGRSFYLTLAYKWIK